jgi:hypothetical protein
MVGMQNTVAATAHLAAIISGGRCDSTAGNTASTGFGNSITGNAFGSFIGSGHQNSIVAAYAAFIGCGLRNSVEAGGIAGVIGGGDDNRVSAIVGAVLGGWRASASLYGQQSHATGMFSVRGDCQRSQLHGGVSILGGSSAQVYLSQSGTPKLDLGSASRVWNVWLRFVAVVSALGNGTAPLAAGEVYCGTRYCCVKRVTNDAGTTLVGAVETIGTDKTDANIADMVIAISADTTDGSLRIDITPCSLAGSTTVTRVGVAIDLEEVGW